ncbi:hypothetical protein CDCA_CDCA12G3369 [Cyanidium caldarium]|uniref:GPN-loop GTPase n=1 Tax=Cyanidium caldarium TaxID=2771 RepID=A0AAV9IYM8_CYACA|nr:hypothetical protein CDCA_CDCA12G3369 [Cyanidium caldarium]
MTSKPTVCLVVGMAGSGKSTLLWRVLQRPPPGTKAARDVGRRLAVNLDPAVLQTPYQPDLDIRDSIKYREVMRQYRLGPNGAILTSLNLFAARFDTALEWMEKQTESAADVPPATIFVDTPGQIEVFTWSASGTIVTESLAAAAELPTVLLFVLDMPRCVSNALTFTSNMLYACSMLYKTRLPLVLVLNKCDCVSEAEAAALSEWMRDFEAFDAAVEAQQQPSGDERLAHSGDYALSFSRSMALALSEFYREIHVAVFSAVTGEGMPQLLQAIQRAREEYEQGEYLQEVRQRKAERAAREAARIAAERSKYHRDTDADGAEGGQDAAATVETAATSSTARTRIAERLRRLREGNAGAADDDVDEVSRGVRQL